MTIPAELSERETARLALPSRRDILKLGAAISGALAVGAAYDGVRADDEAPLSFGASQADEANVALPSLAVVALNRLAWGPRPGDPFTSIEAFNVLGPDDASRLAAYVNQQLDPAFLATPDDSDARIAAAATNLPSLNMTLPQLWEAYFKAQNADRSRPVRDVRVATLLRAIYSRRQLFEVMVDFWHNHFNIFAWDGAYASATWVHYDRDVIRAHALGNFRAMLEAVAKSPAMLYYLDNFISQGASFNENWARELMELHTLGAENYLGTADPMTVPTDPVSGLHVGYVDNDVYDAARCFTGWRVNNGQSGAPGNDGTFYYHAPWHDRANKFVLGVYIPADQGPEVDGKQVLDMLARHPGTGRFIVRKLWRRLIGDNAPEPGVADPFFDAVAKTFTDNWQNPDQIRLVVQQLLLGVPASGTSPAIPSPFATTWGQKIKRPHEALYSALRALNAEIIVDSGGLSSLWSSYDAIGQQHFGRRPPDGYPDVRDAWTNSTSMLYRWRMFNSLMEGSYYSTSSSTGVRVDNNALIGVMGGANTPNTIADFWINRLLGRPMDDPAHRAEVVRMMQGWDTGNSSTSVKPVYTDPNAVMTATDISNRLRRMIAVILMSPEFQWR